MVLLYQDEDRRHYTFIFKKDGQLFSTNDSKNGDALQKMTKNDLNRRLIKHYQSWIGGGGPHIVAPKAWIIDKSTQE